MATVMPSVAPSGVAFTARTAIRTPSVKPAHGSSGPARGSSPTLVANPKLSSIEVESMVRSKVRDKYLEIQQGFQNYDVNQSLSVTKGEFRRVLEVHCLPLTTEQFDALINKVETNPNATIRYCDFLDKFGSGGRGNAGSGGRQHNVKTKSFPAPQKCGRTQSPKEMNTDMIEKMLRDKIQKNLKNVTKGLRLHDYNRDGHVQRHELRKVLESCCFRMSDQQFDKLYQRYDFHHKGTIDYREFLGKLGLNISTANQPPPNNAAGAMNWQPGQNVPAKPGPVFTNAQDPSGLNIFQVEAEFRKKMRDNYVNLKKMFLSFDRHMDGFIAIEDLRSVINNFIMTMSDQLFSQLMDRFQIKASGKVSWEFFLEKFQDPQSHSNGQTVTIKPAHKFFPIRGSEEKMELKDIIRVLHSHVVQAYSSFKQAFLQIDKNRDGKISRKELKNIIENFKFRMADSQFRDLMILLDPQHTNVIDYHKFLKLFEEKETKDGHKWLTSCHRYNDKQPPAIMAWETVEALLQEKISEHWKSISDAVVRGDQQGNGFISPKELRRILEKSCLPISDDHYDNLINKVEGRDEKGRVNYTEFFLNLGVSVRPGDVEGLSTQITDENQHEVDRIQSDQSARQGEALMNMAHRMDTMTPEEVLIRLRDRISQHSTHFRKAFEKYDKKRRGKISKKIFREVIEGFGFYLTDEQFKAVCSQLNFHNGFMTYTDFVANFEDPRFGGGIESLTKKNNHHVNAIRGDDIKLTAEQAEMRLMNKLRENFEGLRGAFYKFDDDHNGILTKRNFRRMLDSFMIVLSDAEFERFCQIIGVNSKSKISYQDFLDAFETRETKDGHKWLKSDHRYNEVQPMRLMKDEEVHEILCKKAHRQYKDLAKAFRTMDSAGNGVITRRELRETLYKFMLPMNKAEFDKLWKRYDKTGSGSISHAEFLRHVSGDEFAPGDDVGTSEQIAHDNNVTTHILHVEQLAAQDQITANQANHIHSFTVDQILQELKDKIRNTYPDAQVAFKKYDKRQKGYLTVTDIQKVLIDFNLFLDDDQFYDFLQRVGMGGGKNSRLDYDAFLVAFEEGRKDSYKAKPADALFPQVDNDKLSDDAATDKMMKKIATNSSLLASAFQSFDKEGTGRIAAGDLRRIIDNFCFKLTTGQFKHFLGQAPVHDNNMVDYTALLDSVTGPREFNITDGQKFIDQVDRQLSGDVPQLTNTEEVQAYLKEIVSSKFYQVARTFSEMDYAKIGVASQDDFREVLGRVGVKLSDAQFDRLWDSLRVNEFGNMDYKDFLRAYGGAGGACGANRPMTADVESRPYTTMTSRDLRSSMSGGMARPFTPMVNAEDAERKVRDKVRSHWKEIQKNCRFFDPENLGHISQGDFRFIKEKLRLPLSEDELRKLLIKYDIRNTDTFCYPEFLKHFIVGQGGKLEGPPGTPGPLLARKKQQQSRVDHLQVETDRSQGPMDRLRCCVIENWKGMRRDFRCIDRNAIGVVSHNEFRQILRQFSSNLSEDEFANMVTVYDHSNSGMINYNEFIRSFLRSA